MTDAIIPAMDKIKIRVPRKQLADFCRRAHLRPEQSLCAVICISGKGWNWSLIPVAPE